MDGADLSQRSDLSVRLVRTAEVARFNALLDEHHWLGHRLFGRVLRYVATIDDDWVACIGFGSGALSVSARDRFIGWSPAIKYRRLRYVANNQRYLVLPGPDRKNLASAVMSRTLRRLSDDMVAAYGIPVLMVETFTDPERHRGTCYKAANFVAVGETQGYARTNGSWAHHGRKKLCWVYPTHRRATSVLAAPFDHPVLSVSDEEGTGTVDLNQVVIDGEGASMSGSVPSATTERPGASATSSPRSSCSARPRCSLGVTTRPRSQSGRALSTKSCSVASTPGARRRPERWLPPRSPPSSVSSGRSSATSSITW
jgi:hypothetical protein